MTQREADAGSAKRGSRAEQLEFAFVNCDRTARGLGVDRVEDERTEAVLGDAAGR